jgi:regulatory protein
MNKKKYKKRKLTRSYLLAITYRYLERYATTEVNLKNVLIRKIERIIDKNEDYEETRHQGVIWIDEIIIQCVKNKLIDDRQYALSRANSFFLSGNSVNIVKNKLRSKGVPPVIIKSVLTEIYGNKPAIDIISCIKYAKRRRFGAYRIKEKLENTTKKEIAAMARAGFSYEDTRKVLNSTVIELEEILYND